jgi:hypothetical protein
MWTYDSARGDWSHDGISVAKGYSGHGDGLNNPSMDAIHDVGPIPVGSWLIGKPFDAPDTGPFSIPLSPCEGTQAWGRSGFRIHGDEIAEAGKELASHGCIILPRGVRELIAESGDTELTVV